MANMIFKLFEDLRGDLSFPDGMLMIAFLAAWSRCSREKGLNLSSEALNVLQSVFPAVEFSNLHRALDHLSKVKLDKLLEKASQWTLSPEDIDNLLSASSERHEFVFLPQAVALLMSEALDGDAGAEVYAPFVASATSALYEPSLTYRVESESHFKDEFFCLLAYALEREEQVSIQRGNPIKNPTGFQQRQVRFGLSAAPWGFKYSPEELSSLTWLKTDKVFRADTVHLRLMLNMCQERIVALVPNGVLFRQGSELDLRQELSRAGWLKAVIQLPKNIFSHTGILSALIVIDKSSQHQTACFIDATKDESLFEVKSRALTLLSGWQQIAKLLKNPAASPISALVDVQTLAANDFDWSVQRYILDEPAKRLAEQATARLIDHCEVIRPQVFKSEEIGETFLEVTLSTINEEGFIKTPIKALKLTGRDQDRASAQLLRPGDVLLSIKGNVGTVGLVGEDCGNNWVASQNFVVLRAKDRTPLDPIYLLHYLRSPAVQDWLKGAAIGAGVYLLSSAMIREIPLLVDAGKQATVLREHAELVKLYAQKQKLLNKIREKQEKMFD